MPYYRPNNKILHRYMQAILYDYFDQRNIWQQLYVMSIFHEGYHNNIIYTVVLNLDNATLVLGFAMYNRLCVLKCNFSHILTKICPFRSAAHSSYLVIFDCILPDNFNYPSYDQEMRGSLIWRGSENGLQMVFFSWGVINTNSQV